MKIRPRKYAKQSGTHVSGGIENGNRSNFASGTEQNKSPDTYSKPVRTFFVQETEKPRNNLVLCIFF